MSWGVSRQGNTAAVASKLAEDFAKITCSEPEETIKNTVASAIATALAAYTPDCPVNVEASGSQSVDGASAVNQLSVKIQPFWNWLT